MSPTCSLSMRMVPEPDPTVPELGSAPAGEAASGIDMVVTLVADSSALSEGEDVVAAASPLSVFELHPATNSTTRTRRAARCVMRGSVGEVERPFHKFCNRLCKRFVEAKLWAG